MSDGRFVVRRVDWAADHDRLLAVRYAVFVGEQGVPLELERDDRDAAALHLLAEDERRNAIGTARMLLPEGHIGRMAVQPAWRGRGVGSRLLHRLVDAARDQGLSAVFLHAQTRALPFYARFGFEAEGDEFMDAGIPHRLMRKRLWP